METNLCTWSAILLSSCGHIQFWGCYLLEHFTLQLIVKTSLYSLKMGKLFRLFPLNQIRVNHLFLNIMPKLWAPYCSNSIVQDVSCLFMGISASKQVHQHLKRVAIARLQLLCHSTIGCSIHIQIFSNHLRNSHPHMSPTGLTSQMRQYYPPDKAVFVYFMLNWLGFNAKLLKCQARAEFALCAASIEYNYYLYNKKQESCECT